MDSQRGVDAVERSIPIKVTKEKFRTQTSSSSTTTTKQDSATDTIRPYPIEQKDQNLKVVLDDGSTTETRANVTKLSSKRLTEERAHNEDVVIQEIGQRTLERELEKCNPMNTTTTTSAASSGPVNVRHVPINLEGGKTVRREEEKVVEKKSEFISYNHEEFGRPRPSTDSAKIPHRDDGDSSSGSKRPGRTSRVLDDPKSDSSRSGRSNFPQKERVVPIILEGSGKSILPTFTALSDPEPPDWSTFSKKNKSNAEVIPVKLVVEASQPESAAGSITDAGGKSRRRPLSGTATTTFKPKSGHQVTGERSRSSSCEPVPSRRPVETTKTVENVTKTSSEKSEKRSQTVRFNLNADDRRPDSDKERPKPAAATMTSAKPPPYGLSGRSKSLDAPQPQSQKPPPPIAADPRGSGRIRNRSGPYYRPQPRKEPSADDPALQEIDKDIKRIWKELQQLDPPKAEPNVQPSPLNDGGKARNRKVVTVREFSTPPLQSAAPLASDADSDSGGDNSKTIWDVDALNLPDPTCWKPNYSTPSPRRIQRSGLVHPRWNRSPAVTRSYNKGRPTEPPPSHPPELPDKSRTVATATERDGHPGPSDQKGGTSGKKPFPLQNNTLLKEERSNSSDIKYADEDDDLDNSSSAGVGRSSSPAAGGAMSDDSFDKATQTPGDEKHGKSSPHCSMQ